MVIFFILKFFLFCLTDAVVNAIWKELISLVKSVIESGNKKERPGSEVLTLFLKSLESIVKSEVFPVSKTLVSITPICWNLSTVFSNCVLR